MFSASDGKDAAVNSHVARQAAARYGEKRAFGLMDSGLSKARPQYDKAIALFDDYTRTGGAAAGAYGDAIGLAGEEGYGRATDAFRTAPGYEFAVNQGLDAIDRRAAARGMLGSGNTNTDTIRFAQGMADQEWQAYLDNLFRASGQGLTAAGGQAGLISGLGDRLYGHGMTKAQLAHGTETNIGQSKAQMWGDINQAKQQAGANTWNAILGVGELAAKFIGGAPA